jgi:hypothetical protein
MNVMPIGKTSKIQSNTLSGYRIMINWDMGSTKVNIALLILALFFFSGCSTYHISTQNFLENFKDSSIVGRGYFFPDAVKGNALVSIKVKDNKGNEQVLGITDRTQVRITKQDHSRTTFYFNTIVLKDSSITGSKTHFFNAQIKPIPFSDISNIEIQ